MEEKISGLQAELESNQDLIMQGEAETLKIFPDLHYKTINVLDESNSKGVKLARLGVSQTKTDKAQESNNLGQSSW